MKWKLGLHGRKAEKGSHRLIDMFSQHLQHLLPASSPACSPSFMDLAPTLGPPERNKEHQEGDDEMLQGPPDTRN